MAVTLPPLSLSTGPAISGGPTSSGAVETGDFIVNTERWQERLVVALPVIGLGVAALWFLRRS